MSRPFDLLKEVPQEATARAILVVANICDDRDVVANTALYEQLREELAAVAYSDKYAPVFARVVYG